MLRKIFGRKRFESELSAEFSDHLAKRVDDLVAGGMPRAEAERQAKREFGPVAKIEDEARESSGLQWIDACARNLRYAVRVLRKSPVFSATVIVTLALCIGANTAIFSVIDAMLFRPLPYPSPERLGTVTLMERGEGTDYIRTSVDGRMGEYLRSKLKSLDVALHSQTIGVNLSVPGAEPRYVDQQRVSSGFFRVLGVQPMLGREIEPGEDVPGGPMVALLSEKLWRISFGSDPGILDKTALLRGEPYRIVGVMPAGFNSPLAAEVWTPLRPSTKGEGSGTNYETVARIRNGFTFAQADAELGAANIREIARGMFGPEANISFKLVSVQRALSDATRQPALLLWAAVGLVLLIGCLNISGLLLARSATRKHEMATRIALGSGRRGLLGQLLAESLVLAVTGGLMGVWLGHLALGLLNPAAMKALGMFRPAVIDLRVLGLTAAFILLTSVVFGLVPALSAALSDLRSVLNNAGRTASARQTSWAQWGLVLGEVALAMVVLACAGFTVRTFAQFLNQDPGFDGQGVSVASISLQDARYQTARQVHRLFDESLESIRQYPGIEAAGVGLTLPYQRPLNNGARLLDGPNAMPEPRITNQTYVTPGYFEALRIGLRRGRLLEDRDREGAPLVALVNEAYLRYYMKDDAEPVGRRLMIGNNVREIVGVVAAVLQERSWGSFGPVSAAPHVYIPVAQIVEGSSFALLHTWFSPHWVVRSETQAGIPAAMKAAVAKVDAQLPFSEFRTMDEIRAGAFARQRLSSQLLGILAGLALILASLGVYGLISGQVTARSREFGIRLALGASRWGTIARTVKGGVVLAALGIAAGWGLTRPAARFLESPGEAWRQIHADDPLTLVSVAGMLIAVAAVASLIPSLRITRIDPARTLREE